MKMLWMAAACCVVSIGGLRATLAAAHSKDAPAAPVSSADFVALEDMDEPVLSPDGQSVAFRILNVDGRRQLAVLDTSDIGKGKVLASFADADIGSAQWIDDKRLIYEVWSQQDSAYDSRAYLRYAIDRDGSNGMKLGGTGTLFFAGPVARDSMGQFVRTLTDGSGDIISAYWTATMKSGYGNRWLDSLPVRFDTRSGHADELFPGRVPHGIQQWIVDGQGHVRAGMSSENGETAMFSFDDQGNWAERVRFKTWGLSTTRFSPIRIAIDGKLYVRHSATGAGSGEALFTADVLTGKLADAPVISARGFDIDPVLIEDRRQHKVIGVRYQTDAEGVVWLDDEMKAVQAKLDAQLPGRINRLVPASCGCSTKVLVTSFSDRQPAQYFVFDRSAGTLQSIGTSRRKIDARQAATTDFYRIKSRDGLEIPVYVTKPHGKGPWPAVVLVHGGPFVRGWSWEWDGESQFLAARGYLVVKPEFRGSDGYGDALRVAGYREWGLKMQDDIADATRWAAKQGLADPERTCIAGASYGGYATLMGLVRYRDLYRCGVAWSAVTDLTLLHDIYWSDMDDEYRDHGMPQLVGDVDKDAAQFAATSPLQQAAHIDRPLLLAHGGVDARVPIDQATKLLRALQSHNAPVDWIEYKDEAHGWFKPDTRASFYDRMADFLDHNIGERPAPLTASAAH